MKVVLVLYMHNEPVPICYMASGCSCMGGFWGFWKLRSPMVTCAAVYMYVVFSFEASYSNHMTLTLERCYVTSSTGS